MHLRKDAKKEDSEQVLDARFLMVNMHFGCAFIDFIELVLGLVCVCVCGKREFVG